LTVLLLLALALVSRPKARAQSASPRPTTYTVAADRGAGPAISITDWTLPAVNEMPRDAFVSKRDGSVWYSTAAALGRFDLKTGTQEEFHLRPDSDPYALVEHSGSGVQSTVYFTSRTGGFVGEFDPNTRDVREFRLDGGNAILHDLTFDPNGVVWFTAIKARPPRYPRGSRIGSINLFSSEIRLAETRTRGASPYGLAVSSKGTPFFTELDGPRLGSVDPVTMTVTEYPLPNPKSGARGLVLTPDDLVWYTDYVRGYLGRFDPKARTFNEWPSPGGRASHPAAIATVASVLWYLEAAPKPRLVRFDPLTQQFVSWELKVSGEVEHLYSHPDGSLWFAAPSDNRITRVLVSK
jgi:virginiamycin B lyase